MLLFPKHWHHFRPTQASLPGFYRLVRVNGGRIEINGMYMCGLQNHSLTEGAMYVSGSHKRRTEQCWGGTTVLGLKSSPAV